MQTIIGFAIIAQSLHLDTLELGMLEQMPSVTLEPLTSAMTFVKNCTWTKHMVSIFCVVIEKFCRSEFNPLTPEHDKHWLYMQYFTLSNTRQFYSV